MTRINRLDWLASFVAVTEQGGFAAGARTLHRSQSRVSSHVADLERALGRQLFDRHHRPALLTGDGEAFLIRARRILAEVEAAVAEIDADSGAVQGRVIVGTHPSIAAGLMPEVITRMRADFPQVRVDITEQPTAKLSRALLDATVDVAVRTILHGNESADLESYPLWSEQFVAVMRTDHPLAVNDGPLDPQDLRSQELIGISRPGGPVEPELAMIGSKWGIDLQLEWRTELPQVVANLVKAGLGVGLLNQLAMVTSETTGLMGRVVSDDGTPRTVSACWDGRKQPSLPTRAFFETLLTVGAPPGTTQIPRQALPMWAMTAASRHTLKAARARPVNE